MSNENRIRKFVINQVEPKNFTNTSKKQLKEIEKIKIIENA